jgi:hypothetical protein
MIVDLVPPTEGASLAAGYQRDQSQPWPGGIIPMVFEQGFTSADFQVINQACFMWSRAANVRCADRTNQAHYVRVTKSQPGCYATLLGTRGGVSVMNIAAGTPGSDVGNASHEGCITPKTVAHEIGHLLGFAHEQQRPDRDQYLDLFPANIIPDRVDQFTIVQGVQPLTAYDFGSIMHYSVDAFSANGNAVMWPKSPYGFLAQILGRTLAPSVNDGAATRAIYGAPTGQYNSDRPGPPVLIGNVTNTNPVQFSWIPDAHTPQPLLYRLVVSSRPGQSGDWGVFDVGRVNSFLATADAGRTYYVSLAAVNQVGGSLSNEIVVRVGAPQGLALSATVTRRDVALRWTGATNVTLAWTLRQPGTIDGTVPLSGSQALFQNLPPGTYHVAITTGGNTWSNIVRLDIR